MELKKVVGASVTHIAEARYKNFNGVNLNNDNVAVKAVKKRTPEEIRKQMTLGYMKMLSK
ncbi:hypothetical protein [Metabacillus sp. Hm71]|uniref:hypothetical protein n=1 Tax=Metabacillus sp. Hm71 TaxID=3450743 RepID=UPI003F436DDD